MKRLIMSSKLLKDSITDYCCTCAGDELHSGEHHFCAEHSSETYKLKEVRKLLQEIMAKLDKIIYGK